MAIQLCGEEGEGEEGEGWGTGSLELPTSRTLYSLFPTSVLASLCFCHCKILCNVAKSSSCFSLLSSSHLEKPASCPLFSHLLWTSFPLYSQVPTTVHPPCTLGICFLPSLFPPPVDFLPSLLPSSHHCPPPLHLGNLLPALSSPTSCRRPALFTPRFPPLPPLHLGNQLPTISSPTSCRRSALFTPKFPPLSPTHFGNLLPSLSSSTSCRLPAFFTPKFPPLPPPVPPSFRH